MLNLFPEFTPYGLLIDFFWASLLLFIGQVLRMKVKILQNFFIPASVIAGVIGLLLSPEFLNVITFSPGLGWYPTVLIIILFASVMLGHNPRQSGLLKTLWGSRKSVFNLYAWQYIQFGFAILTGFVLTKLFYPSVMDGVGMCMPAGFAGGYGYGGAGGGAREGYGLTSGTGLGMTFATLGMLVGIGVGMILINIANRKGYLKYTKKLGDIPVEDLKGIKDLSKPESIGTATMNTNSIDPLGWHVVLILIAAGLGWFVNYIVKDLTGADIPALCLAMLIGMLMQTIFNKVGLGVYVDKKIITRIGASVTDYLVFFGFCTIQKSVITTYLGLILALSALGIVINVFYQMVVAPRTWGDAWFENGIVFFGLLSGVMATGLTLLRVVDPDFESDAMEGFAMAMIPAGFTDLVLIGVVPIFLGTGHTLVSGIVVTLIGFAALALLKITGCWQPNAKKNIQ